jgi:membrane protein CcdC involved in cytochrome C biogenesis
MPTQAATANAIASIIAIVVAGVFIVLRNMRPRRLRVELLWIRPAIFLALCSLYFFRYPPVSATDIAGVVVGFAIGSALGWWRGSLTRIDVDPATDTAIQQASVFGVLLIISLLVVRTGVRLAVDTGSLSLPVSVDIATGWLLALAVGIVVVQQIEIWLRARRVMAQAKAAA